MMNDKKIILSVISVMITVALILTLLISSAYAESEPADTGSTTAEVTGDPSVQTETDEAGTDEPATEPGEETGEDTNDVTEETKEETGENTGDETGEETGDETGDDTAEVTTDDTVAITYIAFETDTYRIAPGEELELVIVFEPEEAVLPELIFTSSDETVLTVDETGKITALSHGKVTVTAANAAGTIEFSCTVIVSESSVKFTLLSGTGEKIASGFKLDAKVSSIIADICTAEELDAESVKIYEKDGTTEVSPNIPITTGMIISVDGVQYTAIKYGDIDCDGAITNKDTQAVADYLTGKVTLDRASFIAADLRGDGEITIENALMIQRHVYNLTPIAQ